MLRWICLFGIAGFMSGAQIGAAPPPTTYQDDTGYRFLTIEWFDGGKANINLRTVIMPGSYSRWAGRGQQTPKGIEFTQIVADDAEKGADYLATGSATKLKVTVKAGTDAGIMGTYKHISDEKLLSLAKKDLDAAEKTLDGAIKAAVRKAPVEDKPAFTEWKQRWPDLRERIAVLSAVKPAEKSAAVPAGRPPLGATAAAVPPEKQSSYWLRRAEITFAAANFIVAGIPLGVQPGWEGPYEDGFGGSIEMISVSNGDVRFTMNMGRAEGIAGTIPGKLPAKTLRTGRDGVATGEFVDDNPDVKVKEGEMQTRMQFRRIGHVIVVESQYAERYAGRGWFDGVYIKRLPVKEE